MGCVEEDQSDMEEVESYISHTECVLILAQPNFSGNRQKLRIVLISVIMN